MSDVSKLHDVSVSPSLVSSLEQGYAFVGIGCERDGHKLTDKIYIFKWAIPGLFFVYFSLFKQTLQFLYQIFVNKMSIQYLVLGFEPTTFRT